VSQVCVVYHVSDLSNFVIVMTEFDVQIGIEGVLEDRDDSAKNELISALVCSIDCLRDDSFMASRKHHTLQAIEVILDHPAIDSSVIISEVLPHVFCLMKDELPRDECCAVHILTSISKKCSTSRNNLLEIAEYLITHLKENFQVFHDELNRIDEQYGELLKGDIRKKTATGDENGSDDEVDEVDDEVVDALDEGLEMNREVSVEKEPKVMVELSPSPQSVTVQKTKSSNTLLRLIPNAISRTMSSLSHKNDDNSSQTFTPTLHKSSSASLLGLLPSRTSQGSLVDGHTPSDKSFQNFTGLPYNLVPEFIQLIRHRTDLHFECLSFLRMLSAASGPEFDPKHIISDFLAKFATWNNRSKARSAKLLKQMVAICSTPPHVKALVDSDILMELDEVLDVDDLTFATKSEAIWLIKVLAKQPMLHDIILQSPVITALVHLLEDKSASLELQMEAFWMMEACCKDERMREGIFQAGALPGMIQLVKKLHIDDPEPLKVLSFLTHNDELGDGSSSSIKQCSESNILSNVVNVLRDGTEEEQLKAQELMITLAAGVSSDHLNCAFADSDALPILLEMLRGKHALKVKALKIVRLLAKDRHLRRLIIDSSNGLQTLVNMVQTGTEEIKVGAGRILCPMISDPDTHNDILMSGLLHVVEAFITHDHGGKGKWDSNRNSYGTKLLSVEILSMFAANEKTKEVLIKSNIGGHLKHLMHHETGTLYDHAHDLLAALEGEGTLSKIFHHVLHRQEDH